MRSATGLVNAVRKKCRRFTENAPELTSNVPSCQRGLQQVGGVHVPVAASSDQRVQFQATWRLARALVAGGGRSGSTSKSWRGAAIRTASRASSTRWCPRASGSRTSRKAIDFEEISRQSLQILQNKGKYNRLPVCH
jgi:hypothetical protein